MKPCSHGIVGHTHSPGMTLRYWFDTEFIEDGKTIELVSIGVVCEDGREFYRINRDAHLERANDWVRKNVFPSLRTAPDEIVVSHDQIAHDLQLWVAGGNGKPEFWAYYGDYDWVVLCQLYGTMMDLPKDWPMFAMDVKQLTVSIGNPQLPKQTSIEHNALNDAKWTKEAWTFATSLRVK